MLFYVFTQLYYSICINRFYTTIVEKTVFTLKHFTMISNAFMTRIYTTVDVLYAYIQYVLYIPNLVFFKTRKAHNMLIPSVCLFLDYNGKFITHGSV